MTSLMAGGNCVLPGDDFEVRVRWISAKASLSEVDVSAFVLGNTGKVASDSDMVFYGQTTDSSRAVHLKETNRAGSAGAREALLDIDLRKLRGESEKVAITSTLMDAQAKGGREIRQAMRDMNGVIERCLQTQQMGDGQLSPEIRQHDLVDAVRAAVGSCSQPHRVQTHLPPTLPVQTDPQLLFIVLSNLLENACKYSASDTTIELQVLPQTDPAAPQTVALALSNLPGKAGWPDPEHVFDKYYRSPQAQRQSGTGLGLYLVKSLAHTLGGKIAYAPTDQQVRFVLTLPLPQTA